MLTFFIICIGGTQVPAPLQPDGCGRRYAVFLFIWGLCCVNFTRAARVTRYARKISQMRFKKSYCIYWGNVHPNTESPTGRLKMRIRAII